MKKQNKNIRSNTEQNPTITKATTTILYSNTDPSFFASLITASSLIFATIFTYLSSLRYAFQFDDLSNITKRFSLRADNPLERWFNNPRWVGDWINSINYKIGKFNPWYYRTTNLTIHCLTGMILFFLTLALCKKIKHSFFQNNQLLITFCVTGLFLLHPVQSQTVSYIIQGRVEGLASLCIAAIVLLFLQLHKTNYFLLKILYLFSIAAISLLACGTKEIIIVTPFLLLLVDWFFIAEQGWKLFKKNIWFHALYIPMFMGILTKYFLNAKFLGDIVSLNTTLHNNSGNILTTDPTAIIHPLHFFISEFKVIVHYIFMFLWPANISVEYDWVLAPSFWSSEVIIPGLFLTILVTSLLFMSIKKKYLYITAPFFWFFICVAPRSSFIPSPELACDYKTYLASYGIFFMLGSLFAWLGLKAFSLLSISYKKINLIPPQIATSLGCLLVFIPIGYSTSIRNTIWKNNLNFWQDCIKKAPKKARARNNYGVALCEAGRYQEAIFEYKKAIELDGMYHDPWSNIAVAYSMNKEIDKAIESLRKAISICPMYPEAYNNLGSLFLEKKEYEAAERALKGAIKLRNYYGKAHFNLARVYEIKKDYKNAFHSLKNAINGDLDAPEAFFKLGNISLLAGEFAEGIKAFEWLIQHGKTNNTILFGLANSHYLAGNHTQAADLYKQLTAEYPNDYRYCYNLAELHANNKNFTEALPYYKQASKLNSNNLHVHYRYSQCLANLKKHNDAITTLNNFLDTNPADDVKKIVTQEIARLNLEQKILTGNGSIKLGELNASLKKIATPQQKVS